MDLGQIYNIIDYILREERGDGFTTDEDFGNIMHMGSLALFNTLRQDEMQKQVTSTALNPFRVRFPFGPANFTGEFLNTPVGYVQTSLLQVLLYDNQRGTRSQAVVMYKSDEWDDAVNSQLVPATTERPVAMEIGKQIEFYPAQAYDGILRYLRLPIKPMYATTIQGGVPVYNPTGSTQLEWADTEVTGVIWKTLTLMGVHLSDAQLTAYMEAKTDKNLSTPNKD